jgi:cytochrome c peroxidase
MVEVSSPRVLLLSFVVIVVALAGSVFLHAAESAWPLSPAVLREIAQVEAEIDRIEAQTLQRFATPPGNQVQQIELLGKAMLYDKQLSVHRNEACAFCHMPETGFTGPVSELNRTTGSYPGSIRTRFSERKPQSHAYAPLAPVLHYNAAQGDLVGGNFWDMRATGRRLGSPAAEQAQGPPTNPVEMGLPDIACAVYRASLRPYRALFETVWGSASLRACLARQYRTGLQQSRSSVGRRSVAGSSRRARSRARSGHLRSDGAIDRGVRGLARGDGVLFEVRCRDGQKGAIHVARADRL